MTRRSRPRWPPPRPPRSRPPSAATPPPRARTPRAGSPRPTPSDPLVAETPPDEPATAPGGGLVRLRLGIAYDGTALHGWARQPGQRTVQDEVETALATVLRTPV